MQHHGVQRSVSIEKRMAQVLLPGQALVSARHEQSALQLPQGGLDADRDAMNGALEQQIAMLKAGPQSFRELGSAVAPPQSGSATMQAGPLAFKDGSAVAPPFSTFDPHLRSSQVNFGPGRQDEALGTVLAFRHALEKQQSDQRILMANLTAQWEQRFAAICEKMDGRCARYLRLGEVLENALDQMSSTSKDVGVLSEKVDRLEVDARRLEVDANEGRSERSILIRQMEHYAAKLADSAFREGAEAPPDGNGKVSSFRASPTTSLSPEQHASLPIELALQKAASEMDALRVDLEATNGRVRRLSAEVDRNRSKVQQLDHTLCSEVRSTSHEQLDNASPNSVSTAQVASLATDPLAVTEHNEDHGALEYISGILEKSNANLVDVGPDSSRAKVIKCLDPRALFPDVCVDELNGGAIANLARDRGVTN